MLTVNKGCSKEFYKNQTAQKMKFSFKDFFNKCGKIAFLRIWLHLLEKYLMENFLFSAVSFLGPLL